jgi:cyclin-C
MLLKLTGCRFIINDTYRSELCLLYPPHLIAIAAVYLTCVLHPSTRNSIQAQSASRATTVTSSSSTSTSAPRRSSRQATQSSNSAPSKGKGREKPLDTVGWLAGLNVSMSLIATIAQEIISLYCLWDRFSDDHGSDTARGSVSVARKGRALSMAMEAMDEDHEDGKQRKYASVDLTRLWKRMREIRAGDLSHPDSGKPLPVNKLLILQS